MYLHDTGGERLTDFPTLPGAELWKIHITAVHPGANSSIGAMSKGSGFSFRWHGPHHMHYLLVILLCATLPPLDSLQ